MLKYVLVMLNMRWFAYVLLLAVAFAIGLIGTMSASRALAPATQNTPVLTTPTVTTQAPANHLTEC